MKKTVVLYGHLDVQPALLEDGWNTPPFVLTEKNGKLYGRGSSDDKGPVLCWIHAIEGYQALGIDVPVNLKFVFEGKSKKITVNPSIYSIFIKILKVWKNLAVKV